MNLGQKIFPNFYLYGKIKLKIKRITTMVCCKHDKQVKCDCNCHEKKTHQCNTGKKKFWHKIFKK